MDLADQLFHISAERFTIKIRSTRFGKNPDRLLASSQPEKPIHPCGTELPKSTLQDAASPVYLHDEFTTQRMSGYPIYAKLD